MRWLTTTAISWLLASYSSNTVLAIPFSSSSSSTTLPLVATRNVLSGICPRDLSAASDAEIESFGKKLSADTKIYFPGSDEFVKASTRWSNLEVPTVSIVIVPATEEDVAETVSCPC